MSEERVLVINSEALASHNIHHGFHGHENGPCDSKVLNAMFWKGSLVSMLKSRHEENESKRGLVAYIMIAHDGWYYSYQRAKNSDPRLEGSYSIGIGGHCNEDDLKAACLANGFGPLYDRETAFQMALDVARMTAVREATEELKLSNYVLTPENFQFVGIINDESTKVGRCHLGMVFLLRSPTPELELTPESAALGGKFASPSMLALSQNLYEGWSKLLIQSYLDMPVFDK